MSLSIGIVGLPNVGKSTLFTALTKKSVLIANYPFATIDPSVGVVAVPDERLYKLAEFSKTQKIVPAAVEFVDIAGLVKGASSGEGLGNKFLTNIRETDAIAHVVRIFQDDNIIHVDGKIDPITDIEIINMELILADMETVTKRLGNLQKEIKANKKEALIEAGLLERIKTALTANQLANTVVPTEFEAPFLKSFHLLTSKPVLYVLNKKGNTVVPPDLIEYFKKQNAKWVAVDAATEHDMKDFSDEDKKAMREGDGGIDNLIKAGYELLGLITYFTTGEKETRAWTIRKGWTAPMAGTAIHNDFKDKFIKADVIAWDELLKKGNWRTEGKEYVVKDGDVMEFKI